MGVALHEESSLVRLGNIHIDAATLERRTPGGEPWITLGEGGDP